MKKIVIGILLLVFLTGCSANYTLDIENDMIKETLRVVDKSDSLSVTTYDDDKKTFYDYALMYGEEFDTNIDYYGLYSQEECDDRCIFYNKKFINEDGLVGFELSYEFDYESFQYSSIATELIPGFSVVNDGNHLTISGGNVNNYFDNYPYLDEVNLVINTKYKVVSTNLKKEKEGKYIWKTSREQTNDKESLYITLDTSVINDNSEENGNNIPLLLLILGGFFAIIIGFIVFGRRK